MSTKTKLKKVKTKLKKAKTKIESLKTKNTDLQKQLGISEVNADSPEVASQVKTSKKKAKKSLKNTKATSKGSSLSKDLNAKEVIALFQSMNDIEEIKNFTKGEERPSVVQRAEFRINALTKSAI